MAKQKFNLEDIQNFMKQEFNLDWNRRHYIPEKQHYAFAKLEDFGKGLPLALMVRKDSHLFLVRTLVEDNSFKLYYIGGMQDYSKEWQQYTNTKKEQLLI